MPSEKTKYGHVALDDKGVPIIVGSNMKVIEIVLEKPAYGWSLEELYFQHPHLTLGRIYSALAYYWDHQDELDRDIERRHSFWRDNLCPPNGGDYWRLHQRSGAHFKCWRT